MSWWRNLVGRFHADRDLGREIASHIAERVDDLVEQGVPVDDARRTALREFGNPVRCLEDSRAIWVVPWLPGLGHDIRYVSRTLRRQPIFSASVVIILTCGIALVTTLFTVFNATVLRPWPVSDPSSIAVVRPRPGASERYGTLSNIEYRYLREHTQSFAFLASDIVGGSQVGRGDGTMFGFVQTQYVSANYFEALRVGMMLGRGFLQEEEDYRAPKAVVIISERVWHQYFGSDPAILGTAIRVGDREATVVGVAERGFSGVRERIRVDLWLPLPALALGPDGTSPGNGHGVRPAARRNYGQRGGSRAGCAQPPVQN